MSSNRHLLIALGLFLSIVVLGGAVVVWPNHTKALRLQERIDTLEAKVHGLTDQTQKVERLADELAAARRRIELELKSVPSAPDMAGLMRRLSLPVDGVTVLDQTITAGTADEAISGVDDTAMAMPLTVDMVANFDSAFALILAAESMDRLLRVTSVRLECTRNAEEGDLDVPMLSASIGLDAIYEPPGKDGR